MPIHHTSDSLPSTRAGRRERRRKQSRTERLLLKCLKSSRYGDSRRVEMIFVAAIMSLCVSDRSKQRVEPSKCQSAPAVCFSRHLGTAFWLGRDVFSDNGDSNANFIKTKLLLVFVSLVNHLINFSLKFHLISDFPSRLCL